MLLHHLKRSDTGVVPFSRENEVAIDGGPLWHICDSDASSGDSAWMQEAIARMSYAKPRFRVNGLTPVAFAERMRLVRQFQIKGSQRCGVARVRDGVDRTRSAIEELLGSAVELDDG